MQNPEPPRSVQAWAKAMGKEVCRCCWAAVPEHGPNCPTYWATGAVPARGSDAWLADIVRAADHFEVDVVEENDVEVQWNDLLGHGPDLETAIEAALLGEEKHA